MNYPRWTLEESTAPGAEPISTAEAKAWLRVDDSDDDTLIDALVVAARRSFEEATNRSIISTVWKLRLDQFPSGPIWLPRSPVSAVASVSYEDEDGETQTWSDTLYEVDLFDIVTTIRPINGESYPGTKVQIQAVTVTFTAGYGVAGSDVPDDILTALKLILATFYEHRESVIVGTSFQEFPTLQRLIWPHKVVSL